MRTCDFRTRKFKLLSRIRRHPTPRGNQTVQAIDIRESKNHCDKHEPPLLCREGDFRVMVNLTIFGAPKMYIMPKYHLEYAATYPHDTVREQDLCTAATLQEILDILSNDGEYSYSTHRWLRTQYSTVFILDDENKSVVDYHAD